MNPWSKVPDAKKSFNKARTRAVGFWVSSHKADRYDDDTEWTIQVWDAKSKLPIRDFYRQYEVTSGVAVGRILVGVAFADDGTDDLILTYQDGGTERETSTDPPTRAKPKVGMPASLGKALERAAGEKRPLFVHIFSSKMPLAVAQAKEHEKPEVADRLARCVTLMVDTTVAPDDGLVGHLQRDAFPESWVYAPSGKLLQRLKGFVVAAKVAKALDAALAAPKG